jgi:hypothetical protein
MYGAEGLAVSMFFSDIRDRMLQLGLDAHTRTTGRWCEQRGHGNCLGDQVREN